MIRFSCRCGHAFEEPNETAGTGVQCRRCKLLNDVPRLSDLRVIDKDGTYVLDENRTPPAPQAADELLYVFAKTNVDDQGRSIDLRNEPEEIHDIGEFDTIESDRKRQRPRYDPETGELVKPIPVAATEQTQPGIPFARPTVVYARGDTQNSRTSGHILLELVQPINLFVMAFVFVMYLVGALIGWLMIRGLYLLAPFVATTVFVIVAHYGNVVDEIGVDEHDELPRVMRDFRWHEDFWWPIAAIVATLLFCYGPAMALIWYSPLPLALAIGFGSLLAMVGTFFLPAIALTLLTSGSISNLRPDRVIRVIHHCGGRQYFVAIAMFLIGMATSIWGILSLIVEGLRMGLIPVPFPTWSTTLALAIPLLLIGTFAMHAFCWQLAILYRANNMEFPWVGRIHQREPRPPVVRRKPRYVTPPLE